MTDAPRPRFGHGAFLACLEALYLKITGFPLRYEALIGKPAETTYAHAEDVLIQQAREISDAPIRKLYFVGDNPDTDIFGANLYDRFLRRRGSMSGSRPDLANKNGNGGGNKNQHHKSDSEDPKLMLETEMRSKILEAMFPGITESPVLECRAILVEVFANFLFNTIVKENDVIQWFWFRFVYTDWSWRLRSQKPCPSSARY